MNKNRHAAKGHDEIIRLPAFPIPGNKIFERVAAAIGASRGYLLQNVEVARVIGRSKSTTSFWLGVYHHPQVVSLFCLLEQLPPAERHRVIDELCRELPLLDHPRLRHNPLTVGSLKNLLGQQVGLTLVVGGTTAQRCLVLSALGHTFCRLDRAHRTSAGLDVHGPANLVPVENLLYLRSPISPIKAATLAKQLWPEIMAAKNPLILLNGIWSIAPELRMDMVSLARHRHVIIADQEVALNANPAPDSKHPLHIVAVSTARENPAWIAVEVKRG